MRINKFQLTFNIEDVIRNVFRIRSLPKWKMLQSFMGNEKILLADVGATGNPKGVWRHAEKFTHSILFDPDPRASMSLATNTSLYPIGLWSSKTNKLLSLAVNPEASSVYQFNDYFIDDFLNADLHKVVGSESIAVDTMDSILVSSRHLPDFIKVDTEGADLEILKGAKNCLEENCLGVFIEVSFAERHKDAPFFSDTEIFLREHNFILMDLFVERWVRSNDTTNMFTKHQVIWGDALFILNRDAFINRLTKADETQRIDLFSKFIFILLLYQLYDYAYEIVKASQKNGLISNEKADEAFALIESAIGRSMGNLLRINISILLSIIGLVIFVPFKRLREYNLLFLKVQLGELLNCALKFSASRYRGCIVDTANPSSRL